MRAAVAYIVVMLLLTAPSSSDARKGQRTAAKKHFRLGKRLSKKKMYRKAIAEFHKAYKHWQHRVILFNIAMCHAWLGNQTESGTYVRRFLKEARGNERTLPPLLEKVFQATGELTMEVPDMQASLHVDGRRVGVGRATLVVLAGVRVLEVITGDKIRARKELNVPGGGVVRWAPRLKPATSRPRLRPRRRQVGDVVTPPPLIPRSRGVHWAWFTAFTGLAVGLAAGAVGMGLRTRSLKDQFLADQKDASLRRDTVRAMTVTNVLWGLAGAAAVTAGVLAFFTRWRRAERHTARLDVLPTVSSNGVGLSLTWTP